MFDRSKISECFTSLVGWRPTAQNPECIDNLSPELLQSDSDLFINDYPYLSLDLVNESLGPDYKEGTKAQGSFTITANIDIAGDTFEIAGTDFVEGVDFTAGLTANATLIALKAAIEANAIVTLLVSVSINENVMTLTSSNTGVDGNATTISYTDSGSGVAATVSGPTLTGGSGSGLNRYLEETHDSEAIELINSFAIRQKELLNTKSLLKNRSTTTRRTNFDDKVNKRDRFVGFRVIPDRSNSIRIELNSIGVQFDTLQTGLIMYFYASSQNDAIKTFTIDGANHTKVKSKQWLELVDFVANYINEDIGDRNTYYLGYYEGGTTAVGDELVGQAIETHLPDFCGGCGHVEPDWMSFMSITPIEVPSGSTFLSREIFDVENVGVTNETFGLDLKFNALCDISEVICDNKLLFANALKKKIAIKLLWATFSSNELNRETFLSKDESGQFAAKLEMELFGDPETEVKGELNGIVLDFEQIDKVCLPCKRNALGIFKLV